MRLALILALTLTGTLAATRAAPAAEAAAGALYRVADVHLDVRARTASAARQDALEMGQVRALETMLKRLTLSRDWPQLPPAGPKLATSLVSAIEINNERISSNRYQASLSVEFDPAGIRGLLRRADIPFSEARYKPVLILPVYAAGGLVSLWNDNPWHAAWEAAAGDNGLIPYTVPEAPRAGETLVNADTAMTLPDERVVRLRRRYGTVDVIAVRATLEGGASGTPRLSVKMRDYGKRDQTGFEGSFRGSEGDIEALARRAAAAVQTHLEDAWKRQTLARFDQRNRLTVTVPLRSLEEWHRIRERLSENLLVAKVDIRSLTSEGARLHLHYLGDVARLRVSLAQTNLALTQNAEEKTSKGTDPAETTWQLRVAASESP